MHHINRMEETHMTISVKSEKAFDKTQHLFMIKTFNKLPTEGNHLNITKAMFENLQPILHSMVKN